MQKVVFGLSGLGIYGLGMYATYHTYKIYNLPPPTCDSHLPSNQEDVAKQYSSIKDYDQRIDWDEFLMRLSTRRRELAEMAVGDVLEVSAGTCRNLEHYVPQKISSLSLVDSCQSMLETGLVKMRPFKKLFNSTFRIMEAEELLYPDESFDTVIDTFGLCSHRDPVKALEEMGRVCSKHGQILLLEHGRSKYRWMNDILDRLAPEHAKNWGCWWNRDIPQLLKESGLKVVEMETYHFGTTYKVIAKPNK